MFESLPPDTDGDPEDRGSPATGAKRARSNPPALSPEQAPAAAACCLARRAQESRVCSPACCTSAWRSSPPATGATLPARTRQRRRLLPSVAMPAADAAPCALAREPQVRRLLVRRREPPRPRRVRARPLEPAATVASWRPWRRLLLMPRRVPCVSRPGAAAPRATAPRAARLGLRLFGRRGFCSACTVVSVACVCCVSTGRCDPRWRSSGPSCMRERGGGGTLESVCAGSRALCAAPRCTSGKNFVRMSNLVCVKIWCNISLARNRTLCTRRPLLRRTRVAPFSPSVHINTARRRFEQVFVSLSKSLDFFLVSTSLTIADEHA